MITLTGVLTLNIAGCENPVSSKSTLAVVGDKSISQEAFTAFLELKRVNKNDAELVEKYKQEFLSREALAQAIVASPRFDKDAFTAELNEVRKDLAVSQYFEKYLAEAASETAIANYYQSNIDNYTSQKALVSHILLRVRKSASEQERQAVRTKAHEVYSLLKTGQPFADLVARYSEDAVSKKKQGSLGWLTQGAVAPAFSSQVFSKLKAGEPSEPVLTPFGYHIILVNEGPATVTKPLEKVKGDILYQLRKIAKEEEIARLQGLVKIKKP